MPKYFILLLWIEACHQAVSHQCPTYKSWERGNVSFDCSSYRNDSDKEKIHYHCLPTINGTFHEFCRGSVFIPRQKCPLYSEGSSLRITDCTLQDCPDEEYLSHKVYQYPVCFNITTNNSRTDFVSAGISSNSILPTLGADSSRKPYVDENIWNYIAFGTVSALLLNVVFIAVCSRSKRCRKRSNVTHDDHHLPNIISQQYDESWELRSPIQSVVTGDDAQTSNTIYDDCEGDDAQTSNTIYDDCEGDDAQTSNTIYDDCEAVYNHLNNKRAYLDNVTGDDY